MSQSNSKVKREGMFGAIIQPQTLMETDRLRGDVPRSKWIEHALKMYNASVKNNNDNQNGVKGLQATTLATPPTPTTPRSTEALVTTKLTAKEVFRR
jgi:hypothetical protein